MRLPNKEKAFIPREKLKDYLLSPTHPVGKSKARFFSKLGFDKNNFYQFESAILKIAHEEQVIISDNTPYGTKYIVDGNVNISERLTIKIRTVWIIEIDNEIPRFVTAYPV